MKNILKNPIIPISIIFIAVIARLIPHVPNFAPIAAVALFGGTYLPKKFAFIIPLLAMFFSDIFLGFHSTMIYVYGSFVLTTFIGLWIRKNKKISNTILGTFGASILFFLITNFGVWANGMYSRGIEGLTQSYIMAIPFFRFTLAGDLFYTGIFFVGYELILMYSQKYAKANAKA